MPQQPTFVDLTPSGVLVRHLGKQERAVAPAFHFEAPSGSRARAVVTYRHSQRDIIVALLRPLEVPVHLLVSDALGAPCVGGLTIAHAHGRIHSLEEFEAVVQAIDTALGKA